MCKPTNQKAKNQQQTSKPNKLQKSAKKALTKRVEKRIIIKLTHERAARAKRRLSEPRGIPENLSKKASARLSKEKANNIIQKQAKKKSKEILKKYLTNAKEYDII